MACASSLTTFLAQVIILGEDHLRRVLKEYTNDYFDTAWPHQGLGQKIPARADTWRSVEACGTVVAKPILGGLHHDCRRAA